jgi:hypothetical protein
MAPMTNTDLLQVILAPASVTFYVDQTPADSPRPTLELRMPPGTPDRDLRAAMLAMAALVEKAGCMAPPWDVDFYPIDEFVGVVFLMCRGSGWSADELNEASALMRPFVTI